MLDGSEASLLKGECEELVEEHFDGLSLAEMIELRDLLLEVFCLVPSDGGGN